MESELRDGYKMTELGALPEEWEVTVLGDVCAKAINGGTPSTDIEKYWTGVIPWITGADILSQTVSKIRRYITEEAVRDSSTNVIPKGSLLIVTRTGVGKLAIAPFDVAVSQDFTGVIPNDNTTTEYLFWLLNKSVNYFLNLTQGTSINGITRNDLMSFVFPLPPLPEQHRIATILSTLDETAEHTEALIEKYKNIKAGLMSDLLTRGIDEEGRIRSEGTHRFKDSALGRVPEEWEVKEIIETCRKPQYGYTQSASDKPIGPKFLRITDIQSSGVNWDEAPYCNCSEDENDKYLLEAGDILFARTGATTGKSYLIKECPKAVFASYLIRIKPKNGTNPNFLFMFFDSTLYWKQINEKMVGSAQEGLNATVLSKLKFPLPPLQEQRRIAEILTAADQRIEKEGVYRDKLLQLKKGLMQDLLTGKVRVKDGGIQMLEQSEN